MKGLDQNPVAKFTLYSIFAEEDKKSVWSMDGLASLLSGLSLAEKKQEYLSRIKPALSALSRADIAAGL